MRELFQLPGGGASERKGHLTLPLKDENQGDTGKSFEVMGIRMSTYGFGAGSVIQLKASRYTIALLQMRKSRPGVAQLESGGTETGTQLGLEPALSPALLCHPVFLV